MQIVSKIGKTPCTVLSQSILLDFSRSGSVMLLPGRSVLKKARSFCVTLEKGNRGGASPGLAGLAPNPLLWTQRCWISWLEDTIRALSEGSRPTALRAELYCDQMNADFRWSLVNLGKIPISVVERAWHIQSNFISNWKYVFNLVCHYHMDRYYYEIQNINFSLLAQGC